MLGKKIPTILALLFLFLAIGGVFLWRRSVAPSVDASIVPKEVKITNIADNKFTVSWTTSGLTNGAIEYGKVGETLDKRVSDDRGESHTGLTHHVTVADLQPNTNYAFRILSGTPVRRFDNNGSVYSVATGSTISGVPAARSLYGEVNGGTTDTLVYVTMPDAQPASMTLTSTGSYSIPLSTIRSADMRNFVTYDPAATVVSLFLDNGKEKSQITASTTNISPVPVITLGQDADFRNAVTTPTQVAQVELASPSTSPQEIPEAQTPDIFNVEPLAADINVVTNTKFTLTNPGIEGEVLSTTKPAFSGTGEANTELTITVSGQKTVTDKVRVPANGSWTWTPAIVLPLGKQKIAVSYVDKDDKTQKIERGFSVSTATSTSEPAFVSTPSASINPSTASASVSPSPRSGMPATGSGVPVTGVMTPTLLTLSLAFAIMITGALLLAL